VVVRNDFVPVKKDRPRGASVMSLKQPTSSFSWQRQIQWFRGGVLGRLAMQMAARVKPQFGLLHLYRKLDIATNGGLAV
jgi:hypothetical protein